MAELKKSLGFFQLLALGVAGVIGSSWIYTNSSFFEKYGAGGMIFGMAVGGMLAATVALAYSELTTLFPRAGGEVVYTYAGLGRGASFWTGWFLIGAYVSSTAFYVTAFGLLLEKIWPGLNTMPLYTINEVTVNAPTLILGVALTLVVFGVNWVGVKLGGQMTVILFGAMVLIGIALVVFGFAKGSPDNFWPPYAPAANALADTLRFVVPAMTYMAGFGLVASLAEDANIEPRRIGRITVLTVIIATTYYCLVLLSSAWVQPWEAVAKMKLGTISAFEAAGLSALGWGAWIIAILGLLTSFLGLFMAISRISMAMARAQLLPHALGKVDERSGAPRNALLFTLGITLGLGWLGKGAILWFLDTGGIYLGVVWILVVATKFRLPKRYPHLRRTYQAGWWPLIGAVGAGLVILLTVLPSVPGFAMSLLWPGEYVVLAVWLLIGLVLFFLSKGMDREEALTQLLGKYKRELDANLGDKVAAGGSETIIRPDVRTVDDSPGGATEDRP